ncbi:MAG: glycosyltransferase family 39 protein, partial [Planctomycetota bacterium]
MSPAFHKSHRLHTILLVAILAAAFLIKLRNLGHSNLTYYDESFHALVASNLLHDPLKPVLHRQPWLPFDYTNWRENHVWLHKGTLPLWQIAVSFALLGKTTLALRVPSLLLATASVWLTYAIGRRTVGRIAALIAAAIQALSPALLQLAHGYWFSDHIDTALLFWVELGMYAVVRALHSRHWGWIPLAGAASGCAFLSKSFPGLIVLAVITGVYLLTKLGVLRRVEVSVRPVMLAFVSFLIVAAPWTTWCAWRYPNEFQHEMAHVGRHLTTDVEEWAGPWDRVLFDYCIIIYGAFYPIVILAVGLSAIQFVRSRPAGQSLLLIWGVGALAPFLIATTKTPTATLIAMPAFLLLAGRLLARALKCRPLDTALVLSTAVMALLYPIRPHTVGQGYPSPATFGAIMMQNKWVLVQVIGASVLAAGVYLLVRQWTHSPNVNTKRSKTPLVLPLRVIISASMLWMCAFTLREAWTAGTVKPDEP